MAVNTAITLLVLPFAASATVLAASSGPGAEPQVVCCGGGGYTYPSSSPYFVMNIVTDRSGQRVVLRQGDTSFRWHDVVAKHSIVTWMPLTMALERGGRCTAPRQTRSIKL